MFLSTGDFFRDGYEGQVPGGSKFDGYTSSTSIISIPVSTRNISGGSVTASWLATGSPVGSLQLQYTNTIELNKNGSLQPLDDYNNWVWYNAPEPPDCSIAVSGAGSALMSFGGYANQLSARWIRLVYTRASGSITFTANYQLKSH